MDRICHELQQGSDAWIAFRATHYGASEAAAMLGISSKVKRNELLRIKKTGTAKEFSDWVQRNVLDYGHEVEAKARPIVEKIIDDTLYPATYSFGNRSASCDGLTMAGDICFEHKQYNAGLFASVLAGILPEEHQPQCQQVLDVTGAEKLIFVCSDGTAEKMAWMWVYPDAAWAQRIELGWAQFERDLEGYVVEVITPEIIAAPVEMLPAVTYTIDRSTLAVRSNIEEFKAAAISQIERSKTPMVTDQDFADRKELCKHFRKGQSMLEEKAQEVVGQISEVATLSRHCLDIAALLQSAAIAGEKLVEAETINRKTAIVTAAREAFAAHIESLNASIGKPYMPVIAVDFAAAVKGLKSLASYKNAADTALANGKIEADKAAAKITANLASLRAVADEHKGLFADERDLVLKDNEVVVMTINARIADEQKRLDAQREKIRAEEQAKAEREAAAKLQAQKDAEATAQAERNRMAMSQIEGIRQQVIIAQSGRLGVRAGGTMECLRETLAETEGWSITEEEFGALLPVAQSEKDSAVAQIRALIEKAEQALQKPVVTAPAAVVVGSHANDGVPAVAAVCDGNHAGPRCASPECWNDDAAETKPAAVTEAAWPFPKDQAQPAVVAASRGAPTLSLGQINTRLEFMSVTADSLKRLGFDFTTERAAKMYHESDFPAICRALAKHLAAVAQPDSRKAA